MPLFETKGESISSFVTKSPNFTAEFKGKPPQKKCSILIQLCNASQ